MERPNGEGESLSKVIVNDKKHKQVIRQRTVGVFVSDDLVTRGVMILLLLSLLMTLEDDMLELCWNEDFSNFQWNTKLTLL